MIQWPTSQKSTVYWEKFPENQTCLTQVFIYSTHEKSQKENSTSWPTLKPTWSNHPFGWILIIIIVYLWHPSGMSQGTYKGLQMHTFITLANTHTHTPHTHTHVKHTNRSIYITNICITSNLLVMIGCQKSEKTNGQWPRGSHPDISYYFVKQGVLDLVWSWPRFTLPSSPTRILDWTSSPLNERKKQNKQKSMSNPSASDHTYKRPLGQLAIKEEQDNFPWLPCQNW